MRIVRSDGSKLLLPKQIIFQLTETMNFSVRMIVLTETNIVAVERIKEYHDIQHEGGWTSEYPLVDAWPHTGSIDVKK